MVLLHRRFAGWAEVLVALGGEQKIKQKLTSPELNLNTVVLDASDLRVSICVMLSASSAKLFAASTPSATTIAALHREEMSSLRLLPASFALSLLWFIRGPLQPPPSRAENYDWLP